MKVSEFKADRPAVAILPDGTEILFKYRPRFLTSDHIESYNEFIQGQGFGEERKTDDQFYDIACTYLASAVSWIDFQDDDGNDIEPTVENLKEKIEIDFPTIQAIHDGIFEDMAKRANPISPTGDASSSGSTPEENSTPENSNPTS